MNARVVTQGFPSRRLNGEAAGVDQGSGSKKHGYWALLAGLTRP